METKMRYGQVTGVDKPVSVLVQGTVYFNESYAVDAFTVYDAAFAQGCNTFDSSHAYGAGECERVLGRWIASRGIRDQVVILDKGAHPYDGKKRVTPSYITSDITDSLERLGVDFIDLYLLHRDDETQPVEPIVDVLNQHQREGHIGAFGGSNWSHERVQAANRYAEARGLTPFVASSPQFSLPEMVKPAWDGCISVGGERNQAARAWYASEGIAIFAWSSLAGGFMTGKYRRDNLNEPGDYFDAVTIDAYAYEDNFRRLDRAQTMAADKGISLPQLGLAYVLNQPLHIFALVGARTSAEFMENLSALDIHLTAAEMAWLNLETDTL
jgi:aryl-alcohol dehydrogenase-like predicted oxidoreductase